MQTTGTVVGFIHLKLSQTVDMKRQQTTSMKYVPQQNAGYSDDNYNIEVYSTIQFS